MLPAAAQALEVAEEEWEEANEVPPVQLEGEDFVTAARRLRQILAELTRWRNGEATLNAAEMLWRLRQWLNQGFAAVPGTLGHWEGHWAYGGLHDVERARARLGSVVEGLRLLSYAYALWLPRAQWPEDMPDGTTTDGLEQDMPKPDSAGPN